MLGVDQLYCIVFLYYLSQAIALVLGPGRTENRPFEDAFLMNDLTVS